MKKMISTLILITIALIILPPASADLNDGLVAFWPFYGNANDESGNGNDGAVFGATLCEDRFGTANSAYCFDGVDDYINIGNNVKPPFPITVSAWVKPYDLHYNGCIFRNDRWDDQSYRYGLATMYNGMGESRSHVFEGFSACWNRRSKTSNDFVASTGIWHHFVVVFHTHDDMRHFWNGIALDGHSECFGSGMTYSSSDGAIGHNISPTGDRYVKAAIDDIRIYNRALSEAEIRELYREDIKNFVYTPVTSCRIVDTRKVGGAISAGGIRSYNVWGAVVSQGGNPAGCPSPKGEPLAVHVNVTSVPLGNGWITAYPYGSTAPTASLVNYRSDAQNVANSGTIKTCSNCAKDINIKSGGGTTHVIMDVLGYYYSKP